MIMLEDAAKWSAHWCNGVDRVLGLAHPGAACSLVRVSPRYQKVRPS